MYDAVVAGAGPAGAATARDIALQGFRVLLLEEHREIGVPNHCSGLVTPRTLALAGTDEDVVLNQIFGAHLNTLAGSTLTIGGDSVHALAIDRLAFDRQLSGQASEAGAELRTGTRLVGFSRVGEHIEASLQSKYGREAIRSRLLIGADGAQSRVARWLGRRPAGSERVVGLSAVIRMPRLDPRFVEVFVGRTLAPGFFAWLIPFGNDCARVGLATDGAYPPQHYFSRLIEAFPEKFKGADFLGWSGGIVPLHLIEKPFADNVMLVGDAAGQVKPTSGGGIYASLVGAKHCARVAAKGLQQDRLGESDLQSYHAMWRAELGQEFERMRFLRRIFLGLSDNDVDRLLRILRAPALQRMIAGHGDIDFPSRLFVKLAVAVPLLKTIVSPWIDLRWPLKHTAAATERPFNVTALSTRIPRSYDAPFPPS